MNHATRMARQFSGALGRWLAAILVSLVLGSIPGGAAGARWSAPVDGPGEITFQGGQLTVRIGRASLRQVMAEVTRLSGAQVRWMDAKVGEQTVSVEFRNLALAEAVRRILRAQNFLLVHTAGGGGMRLTQIWIASREEHGGPMGPYRQPTSQVPPPPTAEGAAAAVGSSTAAAEPPLEALMQTATGDADLAARLSAIGELGSHALDDSRVREILVDLADHDHNPQVREAASMLLGGGR